MFRRTLIAFVLVFFLAPSISWGEGCEDQKWCFEETEYAFRVTPDVMDAEYIRHLSNQPDSPNMDQVFKLLTQRSGMTFIAWVRPIKHLGTVTVLGNIGFQLKNGEVVWADAWLVDQIGSYVEYPVEGAKRFSPGVNGYSSDKKHSFAAFVHFPARSPDGQDWGYRDIEFLVTNW